MNVHCLLTIVTQIQPASTLMGRSSAPAKADWTVHPLAEVNIAYLYKATLYSALLRSVAVLALDEK